VGASLMGSGARVISASGFCRASSCRRCFASSRQCCLSARSSRNASWAIDNARRNPSTSARVSLAGGKERAGGFVRKVCRGDALFEHLDHADGAIVFAHACKMGLEGIVSKRRDSPYRSGRSPDWLKLKNPECEAVRREAEEDWS
jgi:hypothetical protein